MAEDKAGTRTAFSPENLAKDNVSDTTYNHITSWRTPEGYTYEVRITI
ncbi:hypothetical protein CaCOL14_012577 [Colletotrichum acutatum]